MEVRETQTIQELDRTPIGPVRKDIEKLQNKLSQRVGFYILSFQLANLYTSSDPVRIRIGVVAQLLHY